MGPKRDCRSRFSSEFLFTDEATLVEWLRQQTKLPHLSEANPQVYVETSLHPEKLTVCKRFKGWWNPSSKTMKATTLQSMVIGIEPP
ncbi:hypothetical protein TNCV_4388101 [Trichonephila clavipes]|nr:hypothetical protein TNCV_4388101 [Trichonephila clavipes]